MHFLLSNSDREDALFYPQIQTEEEHNFTLKFTQRRGIISLLNSYSINASVYIIVYDFLMEPFHLFVFCRTLLSL